MKLNQEQKDLLIGILEHTKDNLDIQESMEFGTNLIALKDFANDLKIESEEKTLVFDDFISYCEEDNEELANGIKCWISDYFDVRNRVIPIEQYEIDWINENIGEKSQRVIFGKCFCEVAKNDD